MRESDIGKNSASICIATYSVFTQILQMKWLLANVAKVKEAADQGQLMMGNIDAWLIWYVSIIRIFQK